MRANTVIGGIILAILLSSVVYAFVAPIISGPIIPIYVDGAKVRNVYSLNATQAPGVNYVDLNFTIKAGGLDINFTDDSNLIYKFVFEQDEGVAAPSITNVTVGNKLLVNVTADSGNVKAIFGNNYNYSGALRLGAGGISAVLSEDSNVDSLDLVVKYAGGLSVEILDNASFNHLNTRVNTGGIILSINATTLERNSTISSVVEVGGVIVDKLPNEPSLGIELTALVDLGGKTLNLDNYDIIIDTPNECKIRSTNYLTAPTKLDIDIFTGAGGVMINQPFFLNYPMPFG